MATIPAGNNSTIPANTPTTSPFTTSIPPSSTPPTSLSTPSTSSPPPVSSSIPFSSQVSSTLQPPTSVVSSPSTFSSPKPTPTTRLVTETPTNADGKTTTIIRTSIQSIVASQTDNQASQATDSAAAASSSAAAGLATSNDGTSGGGGLQKGPKIAIAVVIPIVVVSLLVLAGLWFWRKRKARKDAEELRRKEMEEYGLNPNHDPTIPAVGGSTNGDEASTMRERDAGYRGWGTTSSNTRKASTTMSSNPGMARSDSGGNGYKGQGSPTGNMTNISDPQSGDPLMAGHHEEGIGALGAAPATADNRGGVNRGPSNASSAYSGANRSEVSALSGDGPLPNGSPPYAQDYMHPDESYQSGWADSQPVIRDVSARRNTRIENPSIIPQQGNAGISQNF